MPIDGLEVEAAAESLRMQLAKFARIDVEVPLERIQETVDLARALPYRPPLRRHTSGTATILLCLQQLSDDVANDLAELRSRPVSLYKRVGRWLRLMPKGPPPLSRERIHAVDTGLLRVVAGLQAERP